MPPVSHVDRQSERYAVISTSGKRPQIRSLLKPVHARPPYGPLPRGRASPPAQDDLHAVLRPERDARHPLPEMREHGAPPEGEGSAEGMILLGKRSRLRPLLTPEFVRLELANVDDRVHRFLRIFLNPSTNRSTRLAAVTKNPWLLYARQASNARSISPDASRSLPSVRRAAA